MARSKAMVPRTVLMAKEVAAQFTSSQLGDYGNIILNGYAEVIPNTINKKAWQYKETATAPVNLPSLTEVQPALKGWATNYQEYYTQLQPNGYGVNPGDPTMFGYFTHSFSLPNGTITGLGPIRGGSGYTTGPHTNVPAIGGRGTGATLDLNVGAGGVVVSATINNPGTGYVLGDGLTVTSIGPGTGFAILITSIGVTNPGGDPRWAQSPRRLINSQVASFVPPTANQQAIQYSAILYPVADNPVPPPIDVL